MRDRGPDGGYVSRTGPAGEASTTSVELPPAADSTNTDACQDGYCEVVLGAHTILIVDETVAVLEFETA